MNSTDTMNRFSVTEGLMMNNLVFFLLILFLLFILMEIHTQDTHERILYANAVYMHLFSGRKASTTKTSYATEKHVENVTSHESVE